MKNLMRKYKEIILYLVFGVLTTVVNIVTYAIFAKMAHIDYQVSTVIAWIVSVTFAYVTNKIYVFESKGKSKKETFKEFLSFYWFRIVSLGFDIATMYIMVDLLHVNDIISKIVANVIVVISNYAFSKLFIFKKEES